MSGRPGNTGHSDWASKGRSAEGGVWQTEVEIELARLEGKSTAGVLFDMEKFYDYVGWDELVDEAIEQ